MSVVSLSRARAAVAFRSWPLGPFGREVVSPTSETADRWLIRLRWVAIVGMLATTLIAKRLVPDLDLRPILAVLAILFAGNLGWRLWVSRRPDKPPLVTQQIVVDVGALT